MPIRETAPSADAVGHWSEREPGLAMRAMWQMPVPAVVVRGQESAAGQSAPQDKRSQHLM